MLYHGFLPQAKPTHAVVNEGLGMPMPPMPMQMHVVPPAMSSPMKSPARHLQHQRRINPGASAAASVPPTQVRGARPAAGGPGFLYNLLTSADARSVQRRSAFFNEPVAPAMSTSAAEEFPRRSNSLTLRRCNPGHPVESADQRPSSVPHHPRRHHPYAVGSNSPHSVSPAPSTLSSSSSSAVSAPAVPHQHQQPHSRTQPQQGTGTGSEPLDLCVRADCSDSESVSSTSTEGNMMQPLLRNILQRHQRPPPAAAAPQVTEMEVSSSEPVSASVSPAVSTTADDFVQLSKKQAHVVRARVTQWMKEAVDFAVEKPVFQSLSTENQLALLKRAWPRLLLLSMAEGGCHIAVSTCQRRCDSSTDGRTLRQPTRGFSDSLVKIIQLGHSLGLDETAFNLLRLAAIFKSDNEAEVSLSQVHAEILAYVHSHLKQNSRADSFPDVVRLLAILTDVDREQMESLLCSQLPNSSVESFLQERVQCTDSSS